MKIGTTIAIDKGGVDMNVLEIIELRTIERDEVLKIFDFQRQLAEYKKLSLGALLPYTLGVYEHESISTDLCIHILYREKTNEKTGPEFGLILGELLKDWGSVNYSVWRQNEKFFGGENE
jgi:hypothetical protein